MWLEVAVSGQRTRCAATNNTPLQWWTYRLSGHNVGTGRASAGLDTAVGRHPAPSRLGVGPREQGRSRQGAGEATRQPPGRERRTGCGSRHHRPRGRPGWEGVDHRVRHVRPGRARSTHRTQPAHGHLRAGTSFKAYVKKPSTLSKTAPATGRAAAGAAAAAAAVAVAPVKAAARTAAAATAPAKAAAKKVAATTTATARKAATTTKAATKAVASK